MKNGAFPQANEGNAGRHRRRVVRSPAVRTPAFTLMELLVVVGMIALLAGLLLPALAKAKARGQRIACVSNLKQFAAALHLYALDNTDRLPPNLDGKNPPPGQNWFEGWLGLPGPDCTNTLLLQRSLLGRYLGESKVWQCPASRGPVTVAGVAQPRVRTVSLNCFMGSPIKSPAATTYQRFAEILAPTPAQALTFVAERVDTINDGSFAMQWDFEPERPALWTLRDKPEVVHGRSGNLSFADGHAATQRWQDPRTLNAPRNDALMPGNRDVLWMQQHATKR